MDRLDQLRQQIEATFGSAFGSTPIQERVADILAQATALDRYRDLPHLKQEAGDLFCSLMQLCNENQWNPADLVADTLRKIESRTEIYHKLGRKLRVGLLGGAFDPVHISHLGIARTVLESGAVDEVWLMPCFDHLGGKSMAPAALRLEMCRIAIRNVRGLQVFDYEIRHEFRGETYHLIKKLLSDESAITRVDYAMILGQDNADSLRTWSNGEGLERLIPFLVVPRLGCDTPKPNAWYLKAPHRFIEPSIRQVETSSTEIRSLLSRGEERVAELLPEGVLEFIQQNKLYLPTPTNKEFKRIAIYSSSFDPPSRFHRLEVQALLDHGFDQVIVCPVSPRRELGDHEHALPRHRAAMTTLAFRGMERVTIDYSDLSLSVLFSPAELENRYSSQGEVWHVVDVSMVERADDRSVCFVQSRWDDGERLWRESRFAILTEVNRKGAILDSQLPPQNRLIPVPARTTSTELRTRVYRGESIADCVDPDVESYIQRHRLFVPGASKRQASYRLKSPRLLIVSDDRNPRSVAMAKQYAKYESKTPNLILVLGGDGTMLRAVREHWRLRVPFVGLNTGHLGFLMNERLPGELDGIELVSYNLPMLRIDVKRPDGDHFWGLAYTDVWLERAEGQAAWLRIDVDGETRVSKIVGDGMLIATAAGSSAYARAMGAIPVPIDTPTLTLAGSNVFQPRFWKPMVLSEDSLITFASLDYSGKRPVRGFIDGCPLGLVQEMTVRRSLTASVELAFTKEFDPSARLLRSLFPPDDKGNV